MYDISDENLPEELQIGKKVEFEIHDLISFRSIRPTPQNIPGQFTNEFNMRYYPTRWLFASISFVNFKCITRYPPHISISCIAVQLDVHQVSKFEIAYASYTNQESKNEPIIKSQTYKKNQ